jgi:hypothetical protein
MLIYSNIPKRKKRKPNAKQRALQASWEEILNKYEVKETKKRIISRPTPVRIIRDGADTSHIPSLDTGYGAAVKKESPVYTGDAMIGIGQLHKSNAIPIFQAEDAVDISKMRRG